MGLLPAQKGVRTGGLGMPLQSLSQTRAVLTICGRGEHMNARIPCSCFLEGYIEFMTLPL